MRGLIVGALVLGVSHPLVGQATTEELARCAAIPAAVARLSCYDALSKRAPDTTQPSVQEPPSGKTQIEKWVMSVEVDAMTDQKNVSFTLLAEGADQFDRQALIIRCRKGELAVYVHADAYLADHDEVVIRYDTEEPQRELWNVSENGRALFYPPGYRGANRIEMEDFVRGLAHYGRVAIQVKPWGKTDLTMVFDLAGAAQVNQALWAVCPPQGQ